MKTFIKEGIKELINDIAWDRETDREIALNNSYASYVLCIIRQSIPVFICSLVLLLFITLSVNIVYNKAVSAYHNITQEYDNYINNRITEGNGEVATTLSNGDIVNVTLKDGMLNVTINGTQLKTRDARIYSYAQIKDDTLHLIWFNGSNEVINLKETL